MNTTLLLRNQFVDLLSRCHVYAVPKPTEKIARLEATLRGLEFPNLGDANGDATWDNAVEMVKAAVGDGFELRRLNKTRVRFSLCFGGVLT